jgi:hypothetical protein
LSVGEKGTTVRAETLLGIFIPAQIDTLKRLTFDSRLNLDAEAGYHRKSDEPPSFM